MTPIDGFIIAVVVGWMVPHGRWAAMIVLTPWLAVLVIQTWYIAAGLAVNSSSTVTHFPQAAGYWLVQAIVLALVLGIAGQLGAVRARGALLRGAARNLRRQTAIASAIATVTSAVLVAAYFFDHGLFASSGKGNAPVLGGLGMLLLVVAFVALGAVTLRHRRARTDSALST